MACAKAEPLFIDLTLDDSSDAPEEPNQAQSSSESLDSVDLIQCTPPKMEKRRSTPQPPATKLPKRPRHSAETGSVSSHTAVESPADKEQMSHTKDSSARRSFLGQNKGNKLSLASAEVDSQMDALKNRLVCIDQSQKNDQAAKFIKVLEDKQSFKLPGKHLVVDYNVQDADHALDTQAGDGSSQTIEYMILKKDAEQEAFTVPVRTIAPTNIKLLPKYTHYTPVTKNILVDRSELPPNPRKLDSYSQPGDKRAYRVAPEINLRHDEDVENSYKLQRLIPYQKRIAKAADLAKHTLPERMGDTAISATVEKVFGLPQGFTTKLEKRAQMQQKGAERKTTSKLVGVAAFMKDCCQFCGVFNCDNHYNEKDVTSGLNFLSLSPSRSLPSTMVKKPSEGERRLDLRLDPKSQFARDLSDVFGENLNQTNSPPKLRKVGINVDGEHSHDRRPQPKPCAHEGYTCAKAGKQLCSCVREQIYCSKACKCEKNCNRRFPGCKCKKRCTIDHPAHASSCACVKHNRECDPDVCHAPEDMYGDKLSGDTSAVGKSYCGNCDIQKGTMKSMYAAKSREKGYGLFMLEDAEKNDFIGEYVGEIINTFESDRRLTRLRHGDCKYPFDLNTEQVIDAARFGNLTRFINHSESNVNCYPVVKMVNGGQRIGFYAMREIRAGEELFFDYGKTFADEIKEYTKRAARAEADGDMMDVDDGNGDKRVADGAKKGKKK